MLSALNSPFTSNFREDLDIRPGGGGGMLASSSIGFCAQQQFAVDRVEIRLVSLSLGNQCMRRFMPTGH